MPCVSSRLNNFASKRSQILLGCVVSVRIQQKSILSSVSTELPLKHYWWLVYRKSRLPTLFDAFHSGRWVDHTSLREQGLAWPISKQLVELMGGEIWAKVLPGKAVDFLF